MVAVEVCVYEYVSNDGKEYAKERVEIFWQLAAIHTTNLTKKTCKKNVSCFHHNTICTLRAKVIVMRQNCYHCAYSCPSVVFMV